MCDRSLALAKLGQLADDVASNKEVIISGSPIWPYDDTALRGRYRIVITGPENVLSPFLDQLTDCRIKG